MPKQIPQFCVKHKTRAMVDVLHARCVEEGCEKNALYGVRSNKAKLYCTEHAAGRPGLKNRGGGVSCTNEACSKLATFGYPGQPAIYCKTCIPAKLTGQLVNVVSRLCEHADCFSQPSFGSAADRVGVAPRFCKTHKLADMMNVRTRLCEVCGGYMKGGGYKLDGDKRVRWCVQCKPDNAIPGRPSTKKKKSTDSSST
eukprot:15406-Heterococcus_DN1.PRE.4